MKSILKCGLVLLVLNAMTSHAALTVTNIAAGGGHSLFLKSDGSMWVMGNNLFGQLGDGTFNGTNRPEQIVSNGVVAIAGGDSHSLFIKSDGSLWAMGENNEGELGDGTFTNTNRPEQIVPGGVVAIACGGFHSLFLKSDGSLWGMGRNNEGELGDGTFNDTNQPEQIIPNGVLTIAGGGYHSLFITTNGSLWGMGDNRYTSLALAPRIIPTNQCKSFLAKSWQLPLDFTIACSSNLMVAFGRWAALLRASSATAQPVGLPTRRSKLSPMGLWRLPPEAITVYF